MCKQRKKDLNMFDSFFCKLDRIEEQNKVIIQNQHLIFNLLKMAIKGEKRMSAELDALTAEVARNTSVEASAAALIQGIADQLAAAIAAGADPAALTALTQQLSGSADALAAAVAANTPAPAPAPVETPPADANTAPPADAPTA
jgi:hypothetical protein